METLAEIERTVHKSVMVNQVMEFLNPVPGGVYVDCTLGLGGHTEAILEFSGSQAEVIGLDLDDESILLAKKRLLNFTNQVHFVNKNFSDIDTALESLEINEVDGIIADLGMSSFQLDRSGRGFSFSRVEPLDMRMDATLRFTARDLVNEMDEEEIWKVLQKYGEEKWAKKIAKDIVKARRTKPLQTTLELANVVSNAIPRKFHPVGIHPATRTFQALRISVNNELENLEQLLDKAVSLLKVGGRIIIISFHSLEDRIVKDTFRKFSSPCICPPALPKCGCGKKSSLKILTRSPLMASPEEITQNPRARSAKMRVAQRI